MKRKLSLLNEIHLNLYLGHDASNMNAYKQNLKNQSITH
jgi:hypothetical protein